jgi:hypothetical protein
MTTGRAPEAMAERLAADAETAGDASNETL